MGTIRVIVTTAGAMKITVVSMIVVIVIVIVIETAMTVMIATGETVITTGTVHVNTHAVVMATTDANEIGKHRSQILSKATCRWCRS